MAYDETLAERVRKSLARRPGLKEKKMFGGLCFLVNGNMCCGIVGDKLMVRVGPDRYAAAIGRPHVRELDFTGRPLKGMVYVAPEGLKTPTALRAWAREGAAFAARLPRRAKKKK